MSERCFALRAVERANRTEFAGDAVAYWLDGRNQSLPSPVDRPKPPPTKVQKPVARALGPPNPNFETRHSAKGPRLALSDAATERARAAIASGSNVAHEARALGVTATTLMHALARSAASTPTSEPAPARSEPAGNPLACASSYPQRNSLSAKADEHQP